MENQTVLEITNLKHSYGNRVALEGLSLVVKRGEIFGLLGPNGSGKTTLFRLLSTLMMPQSGHICILQKELPIHVKDIRSKIGIVFQAPSLDGKLTVEENLRHQGHLYGLAGENLKSKIKQLLGEFKLLDRKKDLVDSLSGGLKRRVEIAKSLLHNPQILILDEPSTGLDPVARLDLWQILKQLNGKYQTTILLTTHFMEEAERCDSVALLDQGKLKVSGSPQKLMKQTGKTLLQIEPHESEKELLLDVLKSRFEEKVSLVREMIRIENEDSEKLVAPLMNEFAEKIISISVKKPTLEDVFIQLTGHEFKANENEEVS